MAGMEVDSEAVEKEVVLGAEGMEEVFAEGVY